MIFGALRLGAAGVRSHLSVVSRSLQSQCDCLSGHCATCGLNAAGQILWKTSYPTPPEIPGWGHWKRFFVSKKLSGIHIRQFASILHTLRASKRGGGVQTGGGFPIWTCPSFFVLLVLSGLSFFCFRKFPDFSGIFPICPFPLSRPILLKAPTRNSPEGSATQSKHFLRKKGTPPPPWFSISRAPFV